MTEPSRGPDGATFPHFSGHKLRYTAKLGLGEAGASQTIMAQVERLFETEEEGTRPAPHVVLVDDVTRGLGLDESDAQAIQRYVSGTRADMDTRTGFQRLAGARSGLISAMKPMDQRIPSETRQEVVRRAIAWWKKNSNTENTKSPTMQFYVRKSLASADLPVDAWRILDGLYPMQKSLRGFDPVDAIEDLIKAKYVRRIPTGDPKRPWRYVYTRKLSPHEERQAQAWEKVKAAARHDDTRTHDEKGARQLVLGDAVMGLDASVLHDALRFVQGRHPKVAAALSHAIAQKLGHAAKSSEHSAGAVVSMLEHSLPVGWQAKAAASVMTFMGQSGERVEVTGPRGEKHMLTTHGNVRGRWGWEGTAPRDGSVLRIVDAMNRRTKAEAKAIADQRTANIKNRIREATRETKQREKAAAAKKPAAVTDDAALREQHLDGPAQTSRTPGARYLDMANDVMRTKDMRAANKLNERVIQLLAHGDRDGVIHDEKSLRAAWKKLNPGGDTAELNDAIDRRRGVTVAVPAAATTAAPVVAPPAVEAPVVAQVAKDVASTWVQGPVDITLHDRWMDLARGVGIAVDFAGGDRASYKGTDAQFAALKTAIEAYRTHPSTTPGGRATITRATSVIDNHLALRADDRARDAARTAGAAAQVAQDVSPRVRAAEAGSAPATLEMVNAAAQGTLLVTADGNVAWRKTGPGKAGWEKQRVTAAGDGWESTQPAESGLHVFQNITRMMGNEGMRLHPAPVAAVTDVGTAAEERALDESYLAHRAGADEAARSLTPTAPAAPAHTHVMVGGDTYPHKNTIKAHGGRWDGDKKQWKVPASSIEALKGALTSAHEHSEEAGTLTIGRGSKKPSFEQIGAEIHKDRLHRQVARGNKQSPGWDHMPDDKRVVDNGRFTQTYFSPSENQLYTSHYDDDSGRGQSRWTSTDPAAVAAARELLGLAPSTAPAPVDPKAGTIEERIAKYVAHAGGDLFDARDHVDRVYAAMGAREAKNSGIAEIFSELATRARKDADAKQAVLAQVATDVTPVEEVHPVQEEVLPDGSATQVAPAPTEPLSAQFAAQARLATERADASGTADDHRTALVLHAQAVEEAWKDGSGTADDDVSMAHHHAEMQRHSAARDAAVAAAATAARVAKEAQQAEQTRAENAAREARAAAVALEAQGRKIRDGDLGDTKAPGEAQRRTDAAYLGSARAKAPGEHLSAAAQHDAAAAAHRAAGNAVQAELHDKHAAKHRERAAKPPAVVEINIGGVSPGGWKESDKIRYTSEQQARMDANAAASMARSDAQATLNHAALRMTFDKGQLITVNGQQYRVQTDRDPGHHQRGRSWIITPVGGRAKKERFLRIFPSGQMELHPIGSGSRELVSAINGGASLDATWDPPAAVRVAPTPRYEGAAPAVSPAGGPRAAAEAAVQKDIAGGAFINDRASKVEQRGEDVHGSARAKAAEWKSMREALESTNAEKMFTRDFLARQEPVDLISRVQQVPNAENAMTALVGQLVLNKFPAKPDIPRNRNGAEQAAHDAKHREGYYKAFKTVQTIVQEHMAAVHTGDGGIREISAAIRKAYDAASAGGYTAESEALRETYNNTVRRGALTVTGLAYDFKKRLVDKYGSLDAAAEHVPGHVLHVLEGKSFNAAFGTKKEGPADIDVAALYDTGVMRRKGPESEYKSVAQALDTLDKHAGGKYAMRAVEWGKSVTDKEREHHLKSLVDSFADLTEVLGLPPGMASFNGKLAIAVGARGTAGGVAVYSPDHQTININRADGAGSLAHEWGHFFDNVVNLAGGRHRSWEAGHAPFASNDARNAGRLPDEAGGVSEKEPVYKEMAELHASEAYQAFHDRLRTTVRTMVREKRMSSKKASEYWCSGHEMFARAFERHTQRKLHKAGRENTYLTGFHKADGGGDGAQLWPTDAEADALAPHFDALFTAFRESPLLHKAMRVLDPAYVIPLRKAMQIPITEGSTGATPVVGTPAIPDYSIYHKPFDPKQRAKEADADQNRRRALAPKLQGRAGFFGIGDQPSPVLRWDPDEQIAPFQEVTGVRTNGPAERTAQKTVRGLSAEDARSRKIATRPKFTAKLPTRTS